MNCFSDPEDTSHALITESTVWATNNFAIAYLRDALLRESLLSRELHARCGKSIHG